MQAAFALSPLEGEACRFGVAVFEDGEDLVEAVEHFEDLRDIVGAEGAGVDGGVAGADEVEDGCTGFSGVEVVGEGFAESLPGAGRLGG